MKSWKPRQPRDSGRKKTNPRSDWFFIRGGGVGPSTTTRFINSWVMVGKDEGVWPLLGLSQLRKATNTDQSPRLHQSIWLSTQYGRSAFEGKRDAKCPARVTDNPEFIHQQPRK
jgi:hypothetical protein